MRKRRWSRPLVVVIALATACPVAAAGKATPSTAPSTRDEARALFAQGQAAYEAGRYDEALQHFEAALQKFPAPALWFNIAQCHRRRQDPAQALAALEQYKKLDPKIAPAILADVDAQIAEARAQLAERERQQAAAAAAAAPPPTAPAAVAAAPEEPTPAAEESTWGSPVVLGAVAGGVVVAAVTGSLLAWSLLAPGPTPPSTSLGTVDLR